MSTIFLTEILTKELAQSICWTLFHSVWQGVVFALLAGIVVLGTKRKSSSVRYNLLVGTLILFVITVSATLYLELRIHGSASGTGSTGFTSENVQQITDMPDTSQTLADAISRNASGFLNTYSIWIVLIWMVITLAKCFQLSFGLYGLYRLKKVKASGAGEYWNERIDMLREQMKIKRHVQLLQSALAKVPSVIGYFSPVILFPCGVLSSMSREEVEAILVHELAHIRRHDFLVNLLQNTLEIIFFFNPAVLWISSLVKVERENCCDDFVIRSSFNRRLYINALMTFGESVQQHQPVLVNSLGGSGNYLMHRIKRIIYNHNNTLNKMEKKFLAAGIVFTCLFASAFSIKNIGQQVPGKPEKAQDTRPEKVRAKSTYAETTTDTIPVVKATEKDRSRIVTTLDGKDYEIVTKDGEVDQLFIDGKKVPDDKKKDYKQLTDDIIGQMEIDGANAKKELDRSQKAFLQAAEDQESIEKELKENEIDMEQAQKELQETMEQQQRNMENARRDLENVKQEMARQKKMNQTQMENQKNAGNIEKARQEMELAKKDMEVQLQKVQAEIAQSQNETALNQEQAKNLLAQAQQDMIGHQEKALKEAQKSQDEMAMQQTLMKKQMELAREQMENAKKDMERAKVIQEQIVTDLIQEHVIQNAKDLSSYSLNNEELIVNGKKQPEALHKKFRDKYIKGGQGTLKYSRNADGEK